MSNALTPTDAQSIIARADNPYRLDTTLAPVDWKSLKEQFDPEGKKILAQDLIGQTFSIVELHPFASSFEGARETVYYVRAVDADGELFNTVLGGGAVAEILDSFTALNAAHHQAHSMGDEERCAELLELGATRPITVTLGWRKGGKFSGYYVFE